MLTTLFAVGMEAYLHGVSTPRSTTWSRPPAPTSGISKSEVSRICADLDEEVAAFCDRPLSGLASPYVFLDATYCTARVNRQVVSQAVVIATGVAATATACSGGCSRRSRPCCATSARTT